MVILRPRVFVTRQFFPEALEVLTDAADTEVWPDDEPPTPEQLLDKVVEADGILANIMDRIDADVFQAAHRLKVVSQLGVGVDNIDVAEATRRGVLVGNTPGVLAKATADIAFGLLMSAARRISEGDRWLRAGNWKMQYHPMVWLGAEIHGATLGIVGMGQIGVEMAKRARGFDMRVIYYSRTRKLELESQLGMEYFEPSDLLSTADFVTLHIPLTLETRHFISERELRLRLSLTDPSRRCAMWARCWACRWIASTSCPRSSIGGAMRRCPRTSSETPVSIPTDSPLGRCKNWSARSSDSRVIFHSTWVGS